MEIAFLQMEVITGDREANFSKVKKLTEDFFSLGNSADLFLLPELWSTGYALKDLHSLASDEGAVEEQFLGRLAQKYNVWFAGGSVAAKTKSGIYNRAQIIDRTGKLQGIYDKVHLVPMLDEPRYLAAGDKRCTHMIEGIRFGFAICYDLRFCEFIRRLNLDGAEVMLVSAQWPTVRAEHWKTLIRARAIENQCYLFAANSVATGPNGFAGHSIALAPDGSTLCGFDMETDVKSAIVDTSFVTKLRKSVPVFENRRPELY
jgi:predicted amidohydrolase